MAEIGFDALHRCCDVVIRSDVEFERPYVARSLELLRGLLASSKVAGAARGMELWAAWKGASEAVRAAVGADITAATGLSDPDFGVLTRLTDLGDGTLRQSELAKSMGWHRSRLSGKPGRSTPMLFGSI